MKTADLERFGFRNRTENVIKLMVPLISMNHFRNNLKLNLLWIDGAPTGTEHVAILKLLNDEIHEANVGKYDFFFFYRRISRYIRLRTRKKFTFTKVHSTYEKAFLPKGHRRHSFQTVNPISFEFNRVQHEIILKLLSEFILISLMSYRMTQGGWHITCIVIQPKSNRSLLCFDRWP